MNRFVPLHSDSQHLTFAYNRAQEKNFKQRPHSCVFPSVHFSVARCLFNYRRSTKYLRFML